MKFLLLLLFFNTALAADIISIAASDSIPPYVMIGHEHESKLQGLQVEIVDAAFAAVNLKTRWQTMPNNRLIIHYAKNNVDAALNLPDMNRAAENFSSEMLLYYRNCVIGKRSLKETWGTSLKSLKILGFQSAKDIFSDFFPNNFLENNSNYNEVPSQKTIAYHAIHGRADLIFSDALVFSFYAQTNWPLQYEKSDLVCLREQKLPRHIGFKSKVTRDLFNKGLKIIKANGLYDSINSKYSKLFSHENIFQSRSPSFYGQFASTTQ
tara:strand:- start:2499 stop:3296 length:798 start_codon:yes stop_codon:yes gene_type:complete